MTQSFVLSILTQGIILVLLLSAPMLLTGLIIGFIVALLQTITSIQEQTLSFVPKLLAVMATLALASGFMLTRLSDYFDFVFQTIRAIR